MSERAESADDQLRDVTATAGDGDQGALGQAVVERGRAVWGAVSRARRLGAGGDRAVDGGEGAGDVEQPVRLRAADANSTAQYDSQLPCPSGTQTRAACASRTRAASTATERRTSSIASRSLAVISRARDAVSAGRAGSAPCSWSSLCLPTIPSSCALAGSTRARGSVARELHLTPSQLTAVYRGNRL
ncbi:hypothetical protein [Streptomyces sp. WAC 04229]|uniref:hypothetical protein n=1 Tax=Streptomyces sp. WAC 04229 TaxID=2203206 RepID=UPI0021ADF517|nr:hypothetical protein [Streptomyces sp. WAC 04229]